MLPIGAVARQHAALELTCCFPAFACSQADAKDNKLRADVSSNRAASKVFSVLIGQAASSTVSSSVDLSQYAKRAKGSSAFVNRLGLDSALPCFLFNGAFYPSSKVGRDLQSSQ